MNKNNINPDFQGVSFPYLKNAKTGMTNRIDSDSGTGELLCFDVAPGIQISYNDLNMDSCFQPMEVQQDFLQIDHCFEGCYEVELVGGSVTFLGEGDLCVTSLRQDKQLFVNSRIPLKRYRGITVLLEIETAQNALRTDFNQAEIDLKKIRDSLCGDGRSLLIKSKHEVDHIFSELYRVDERIQQPYFWLKIVELLLFLSLLDSRSMQRPQQFSEDTSQKTQEVYQYIIENPFDKMTITDFAKQFHVAESSMKRCFKSIAGVSIGTFMKVKKMEAAAGLLLSEQRLSIGEVAEAAGYENQGKFTAAFKSVHGVTPLAFRCKHW